MTSSSSNSPHVREANSFEKLEAVAQAGRELTLVHPQTIPKPLYVQDSQFQNLLNTLDPTPFSKVKKFFEASMSSLDEMIELLSSTLFPFLRETTVKIKEFLQSKIFENAKKDAKILDDVIYLGMNDQQTGIQKLRDLAKNHKTVIANLTPDKKYLIKAGTSASLESVLEKIRVHSKKIPNLPPEVRAILENLKPEQASLYISRILHEHHDNIMNNPSIKTPTDMLLRFSKTVIKNLFLITNKKYVDAYIRSFEDQLYRSLSEQLLNIHSRDEIEQLYQNLQVEHLDEAALRCLDFEITKLVNFFYKQLEEVFNYTTSYQSTGVQDFSQNFLELGGKKEEIFYLFSKNQDKTINLTLFGSVAGINPKGQFSPIFYPIEFKNISPELISEDLILQILAWKIDPFWSHTFHTSSHILAFLTEKLKKTPTYREEAPLPNSVFFHSALTLIDQNVLTETNDEIKKLYLSTKLKILVSSYKPYHHQSPMSIEMIQQFKKYINAYAKEVEGIDQATKNQIFGTLWELNQELEKKRAVSPPTTHSSEEPDPLIVPKAVKVFCQSLFNSIGISQRTTETITGALIQVLGKEHATTIDFWVQQIVQDLQKNYTKLSVIGLLKDLFKGVGTHEPRAAAVIEKKPKKPINDEEEFKTLHLEAPPLVVPKKLIYLGYAGLAFSHLWRLKQTYDSSFNFLNFTTQTFGVKNALSSKESLQGISFLSSVLQEAILPSPLKGQINHLTSNFASGYLAASSFTSYLNTHLKKFSPFSTQMIQSGVSFVASILLEELFPGKNLIVSFITEFSTKFADTLLSNILFFLVKAIISSLFPQATLVLTLLDNPLVRKAIIGAETWILNDLFPTVGQWIHELFNEIGQNLLHLILVAVGNVLIQIIEKTQNMPNLPDWIGNHLSALQLSLERKEPLVTKRSEGSFETNHGQGVIVPLNQPLNTETPSLQNQLAIGNRFQTMATFQETLSSWASLTKQFLENLNNRSVSVPFQKELVEAVLSLPLPDENPQFWKNLSEEEKKKALRSITELSIYISYCYNHQKETLHFLEVESKIALFSLLAMANLLWSQSKDSLLPPKAHYTIDLTPFLEFVETTHLSFDQKLTRRFDLICKYFSFPKDPSFMNKEFKERLLSNPNLFHAGLVDSEKHKGKSSFNNKANNEYLKNIWDNLIKTNPDHFQQFCADQKTRSKIDLRKTSFDTRFDALWNNPMLSTETSDKYEGVLPEAFHHFRIIYMLVRQFELPILSQDKIPSMNDFRGIFELKPDESLSLWQRGLDFFGFSQGRTVVRQTQFPALSPTKRKPSSPSSSSSSSPSPSSPPFSFSPSHKSKKPFSDLQYDFYRSFRIPEIVPTLTIDDEQGEVQLLNSHERPFEQKDTAKHYQAYSELSQKDQFIQILSYYTKFPIQLLNEKRKQEELVPLLLRIGSIQSSIANSPDILNALNRFFTSSIDYYLKELSLENTQNEIVDTFIELIEIAIILKSEIPFSDHPILESQRIEEILLKNPSLSKGPLQNYRYLLLLVDHYQNLPPSLTEDFKRLILWIIQSNLKEFPSAFFTFKALSIGNEWTQAFRITIKDETFQKEMVAYLAFHLYGMNETHFKNLEWTFVDNLLRVTQNGKCLFTFNFQTLEYQFYALPNFSLLPETMQKEGKNFKKVVLYPHASTKLDTLRLPQHLIQKLSIPQDATFWLEDTLQNEKMVLIKKENKILHCLLFIKPQQQNDYQIALLKNFPRNGNDYLLEITENLETTLHPLKWFWPKAHIKAYTKLKSLNQVDSFELLEGFLQFNINPETQRAYSEQVKGFWISKNQRDPNVNSLFSHTLFLENDRKERRVIVHSTHLFENLIYPFLKKFCPTAFSEKIHFFMDEILAKQIPKSKIFSFDECSTLVFDVDKEGNLTTHDTAGLIYLLIHRFYSRDWDQMFLIFDQLKAKAQQENLGHEFYILVLFFNLFSLPFIFANEEAWVLNLKLLALVEENRLIQGGNPLSDLMAKQPIFLLTHYLLIQSFYSYYLKHENLHSLQRLSPVDELLLLKIVQNSQKSLVEVLPSEKNPLYENLTTLLKKANDTIPSWFLEPLLKGTESLAKSLHKVPLNPLLCKRWLELKMRYAFDALEYPSYFIAFIIIAASTSKVDFEKYFKKLPLDKLKLSEESFSFFYESLKQMMNLTGMLFQIPWKRYFSKDPIKEFNLGLLHKKFKLLPLNENYRLSRYHFAQSFGVYFPFFLAVLTDALPNNLQMTDKNRIRELLSYTSEKMVIGSEQILLEILKDASLYPVKYRSRSLALWQTLSMKISSGLNENFSPIDPSIHLVSPATFANKIYWTISFNLMIETHLKAMFNLLYPTETLLAQVMTKITELFTKDLTEGLHIVQGGIQTVAGTGLKLAPQTWKQAINQLPSLVTDWGKKFIGSFSVVTKIYHLQRWIFTFLNPNALHIAFGDFEKTPRAELLATRVKMLESPIPDAAKKAFLEFDQSIKDLFSNVSMPVPSQPISLTKHRPPVTFPNSSQNHPHMKTVEGSIQDYQQRTDLPAQFFSWQQSALPNLKQKLSFLKHQIEEDIVIALQTYDIPKDRLQSMGLFEIIQKPPEIITMSFEKIFHLFLTLSSREIQERLLISEETYDKIEQKLIFYLMAATRLEQLEKNEFSLERSYAVDKLPTKILFGFLYYEFFHKRWLRPKQAHQFETMLTSRDPKDRKKVVQLIMGEGKTAVGLPMTAYTLSDQVFVPLEIFEANVYPTHSKTVAKALKKAYDQSTTFLSITRSRKLSSEELEAFLKILQRAQDNQETLSIRKNDIKALELKCLEEYDFAKDPDESQLGVLEYYRRILRFLRRFVIANGDEIHKLLNTFEHLNFPLGEKRAIQSHLITYGKQCIHELIQIDSVREKLTKNQQALLSEDFYQKQILPNLAKRLANFFTSEFQSDFQKCQVDFGSLYTYFLKKESTLKNINPRVNEILGLVRGMIFQWIPHVLTQISAVHYGPSIENPEEKYAKPFDGNRSCEENSIFADPYLTLTFTYLYYFEQRLNREEMKIALRMIEKLASYEQVAMKIPLITKTPIAQWFKSITGWELTEISQKNPDELYQKLNQMDGFILFYAEKIAAPKIFYFSENLQSNAQNFAAMFKGFYASTATPYNFLTYPKGTELIPDKGTTGATIDLLKRWEQEDPKSLIQILTSQSFENPQNILDEILQTYFKDSQTKAYLLMDGGALFRGLSNEEVAQIMLDFIQKNRNDIKGVIFHNHKKEEMIWEVGSQFPVLRSESQSFEPGKFFTYLGYGFTFGVDIPQPADEKGVLTVGETTKLENDLCQPLGRKRERNLPGQSIHLVTTQAIKSKIEPNPSEKLTLEKLLVFAIKNEEEQLAQEHFQSAIQKLYNIPRSWVIETLISEPDIKKSLEIYREFREFIIQRIDFDLYTLYGQSQVPMAPGELLAKIQLELLQNLEGKTYFKANLSQWNELKTRINECLENTNEIYYPKTTWVVQSNPSILPAPSSLKETQELSLEQRNRQNLQEEMLQVEEQLIEQELKTGSTRVFYPPVEKTFLLEEDQRPLSDSVSLLNPALKTLVEKKKLQTGIFVTSNFAPGENFYFGNPNQTKPIEYLLVSCREGHVRLTILDRYDEMVYSGKIQNRKDVPSSSLSIFTLSLNAITHTSDQSLTYHKLIENYTFMMMLVQIKFLNGDLDFDDYQKKALFQWFDESGLNANWLKELFYTLHKIHYGQTKASSLPYSDIMKVIEDFERSNR